MNYISGRWDWSLNVYTDLTRIIKDIGTCTREFAFFYLAFFGWYDPDDYVCPACRLSELSREATEMMRSIITFYMKYVKVCLLLSRGE